MTRRLVPLLLALAALAGAAGACSSDADIPGDDVLGTFQLEARLLPGTTCGPADLPDGGADAGFAFGATVSRLSSTGTTWVTVNGVARDAGLEGQTVTSVHRAQAHFERCRDCTGTQLEETLRLVLLTEPQRVQVGGSCALALDGGVALDGGALPPDAGVAAACGSLTVVVLPGQGCACTSCTASFSVESR